MDSKLIDERVKKAYERFYEVHDPQIDELALKTLNDYHSKIENWTGNPEELRGIGFYRDYLVGKHMAAIAADGAAPIKYENYKLVMGKVGTARRLAKLFCIRRDHTLHPDLVDEIRKVNFINYVLNNPAREGFRPHLYTNRILVSIFIEIMTSIANRGHLNETAKLLGISSPSGISFERLQVQVRNIIEKSLFRQDLGNELTKFSRATIAFHVKDACIQ
jgi:hypothetical protein